MGFKQFFNLQKASFQSLKGVSVANQGYVILPPNSISSKFLKLDDKLNVYKTNPVLNAVINKKANLCSKAEFKIVDSKGNFIDNDPLLDLLECPNFWQSKRAFIIQWVILNSLDGGVFNFPITSVGFEGDIKYVDALVNLSMHDATMITQSGLDKLNDYDTFTEKVSNTDVQLMFQGQPIRVPYKELIPYYDLADMPQDTDFINPISRVDSLKFDLSNVEVTLEAMNVMANKPAGIGILSTGSTDSTMNVPMQDGDRIKLENKLKDSYGLSHDKSSIVVSTANVQYTSTMSRFTDLGLNEINDTSILNILAGFGVPPEIFTKDAGKYENKKVAELSFIQDEIQTTMDNFCNGLNSYFGYEDKKLIASFEHLPAFSLKRMEMARTLKEVTESVRIDLERGLINDVKAKQIIKELTGVSYD